MTTHENIRQLLTLSAAGLLEAADEGACAPARPRVRRVRGGARRAGRRLLRFVSPARSDSARGLAGPHRGTRSRGLRLKPASATAHSWPWARGLFAWMATLAPWGLYRLLIGSAGWLAWLVVGPRPRVHGGRGGVRFCLLPPPSGKERIMTPDSQSNHIISRRDWWIAALVFLVMFMLMNDDPLGSRRTQAVRIFLVLRRSPWPDGPW